MRRPDPNPGHQTQIQDLPGLRRAIVLLREEARSFPGPDWSAAISAWTRAIEREIGLVERAEWVI
jgi:hypothetical protein